MSSHTLSLQEYKVFAGGQLKCGAQGRWPEPVEEDGKRLLARVPLWKERGHSQELERG